MKRIENMIKMNIQKDMIHLVKMSYFAISLVFSLSWHCPTIDMSNQNNARHPLLCNG